MYIFLTIIVSLISIYLYFKIKSYIGLIINKKIGNITKGIIITLIVLLNIVMFLSFVFNIRILRIICNYYMGVMLYSILIFIIVDVIKLIIKIFKIKINRKFNLYLNTVSAIIILLLLIVGFYNANIISITNYDVISNKNSVNNNLKIALISDLHIGYNYSSDYYLKVVNLINSKNVDLVLIAGDIFDNPNDEISNINEYINVFKKLKSKYGTYATLGNHDVMSDKHDVRSYIKDMNINLLEDENVLINGDINLIGLNTNYINKFNSYSIPISVNLDKVDLNKPSILMVHEPTYVLELMNHADLIVSGHTHNGQTFPLNLIIKNMYYNAYGIKKKDNATSIVTSGVGLWGPKLRVGTKAEIVFINMEFNNTSNE